MREIKFRGKRVDTGEWVVGDLVTDGRNSRNKDLAYIFPDNAMEYNFDLLIQVSKKTVGQFTGLKDKNGVDIYEMDKLKYQHVSSTEIRRGCVEYSSFDVRFEINRTTFHLIYLYNMEVVGNIHDLKKEV